MARGCVGIVFWKELIDILRDRRTLIVMLVIPMLLYPLMMVGFGVLMEFQSRRLQAETFAVAVDNEDDRAWLEQIIADQGQRALAIGLEDSWPGPESSAQPAKLIQPAMTGNVEQAVARGDFRVGLRTARLEKEQRQVRIYYDAAEDRSATAKGQLTRLLDHASQALLEERVRAIDQVPDSFFQPIQLELANLASETKVGGSILGRLVPFLVIVLMITGAAYAAIDVTAGERERGTLETLMVTPVSSLEVITGKFLVILVVAMIIASLNLLFISLTFQFGVLSGPLARGESFAIPYHLLPLVPLILLPFAALFSAVLLAVCSFARTFKEAQNYITPVLFAMLLPAMMGMVPGLELSRPDGTPGLLIAMPVCNIVLLTRDLFLGKVEWIPLAGVMISTGLYAAGAMTVAARVFGQEAVTFADVGSYRSLFMRRYQRPRSRPNAAEALVLVGVVFALNFYAQQASSTLFGYERGYWLALPGILICLFLLLPAAMGWFLKLSPADTFSFRRPGLGGVLAAVLLAVGTSVLARQFLAWQEGFLPMSPALRQAMEEQTRSLLDIHWAIVLLALAVVPGFCEEVLFRGFTLAGLRQAVGKWPTILITAGIFAVFHFSPQRFLITGGLGVLLAYVCWQTRSLWPAILLHVLHNGLVGGVELAVEENPAFGQWLGWPTGGELTYLPWHLVAPGMLCLVLGLAILVAHKPDRLERARV